MGSEDSSKDDECRCGHPRERHVSGCEECHANREGGLRGSEYHEFTPKGDPLALGWHEDGTSCRDDDCPRFHGVAPEVCRCGHIRSRHIEGRGLCHGFNCACKVYIPQRAPEEPEKPPCPACGRAGCAEEHIADACRPAGGCPQHPLPEEPQEDPYKGEAGNCGTCPSERPKGAQARGLRPLQAPSRRPPVALVYALKGGAQYEVWAPGDAAVTAVDGQLVITHPEPVLGITQARPVGAAEREGEGQ